jgi:trehalose 6-phosphate synthase/phosphatase
MNKTIIVSNRLPLEFKLKSGKLSSKPSVGGLATGLKSVHSSGDSFWIGWSGLHEGQLDETLSQKIREQAWKDKCVTVSLTENDVENYYFGLSNKTIWPLFHYFLEYVDYDPKQWDSYVEVNQKFANTILENAEPGDKVWIHDYQLLLLPKMLRDKNPNLSIAFFLHIPFPSFEILRTFPRRNEVLEGLLGSDLIGFHTYDYVQHFLDSAKRLLGLEVRINEILYQDRVIPTDSFPMGIDYSGFYEAALEHQKRSESDKSELMRNIEEHASVNEQRRLILSIDRMDYTKGIPNRIKAFGYFLEQNPDYREKVSLIMLVVPSRTNVPQYRKLKKETDELVGRINGKYASFGWTPIWYFYRSMPFADLIDLYTSSSIALVMPLRDGMNLVAKEYIATRINQDGVLILSEMAGAAFELNEALLINPNNITQFTDVLKQALEMPLAEQKNRISALQKRLSRYNVQRWASDFMNSFEKAINNREIPSPCDKMNDAAIDEMLYHFKAAKKRIILLDYDGTLVPFKSNPLAASPDEELFSLLDEICSNKQTKIAIVSGRDRDTIQQWFGNKEYSLITDHGLWMKRSESEWEALEILKNDWKDNIRHIMESFVDRTPGAFLEEKQHSIAWHYRKTNPEMAKNRAHELKMILTGFVADHGLTVLDGDKVLEVKSSAVNKGRAVTRLMDNLPYDFIMAIGDDWTDEAMFEELPKTAYTIKVGNKKTSARYFVPHLNEVRGILTKIGVVD